MIVEIRILVTLGDVNEWQKAKEDFWSVDNTPYVHLCYVHINVFNIKILCTVAEILFISIIFQEKKIKEHFKNIKKY